MDIVTDVDPVEITEWTDALDSVLAFEGPARASYILERLTEEAKRRGAPVPYSANTPYLNTIPPDQEARHPGDRAIEHRIRSLIRWNQVTGIGPGYFATPLNQALINNPEFDAWLKKRTPAGRWGRVEELQGTAIFLASTASDFVNGQIVYVDGGVLATL